MAASSLNGPTSAEEVVLSHLTAPFIEYPLKFVERQLFRQPAAEDFDMTACVMNREVIDSKVAEAGYA